MATLTYLTTTHFDFGALEQLPGELRKTGITKPFIATDTGLVAAGLVDAIKAVLGDETAASVFDGTPGNPTEEAVKIAFAQYKEEGCDGVIAFGGG